MNTIDTPDLSPDLRNDIDWTEAVQVLHELVPIAKSRLSKDIWDYLAGAAETETAMRRNRLAIDSLALRPRPLRDITHVDGNAELFGKKLNMPMIIAPVGSLESFTPDGAAAGARAARAAGVMLCQSSVSQPALEETARAAGDAARIFQLYVRGDGDWIDAMVDRCVAAEFDAFCITVDTQSYSRRERDIANRFVKPWRVNKSGWEYQVAFNWKDVARFKNKHDIPLLLKGIMTAEDAELALQHGVDGIWVSNHGGRQLDHVQGTMSVLPEIIEITKGKAKIIIDGGFWRGSDIVKALAMGADAIAMGRLPALALGAGGAPALTQALAILQEEYTIALRLLGITDLSQLGPDYLTAAPSTVDPSVFSALALLGDYEK